MLLIRPVATTDHTELLVLAREAGIGFTSLPADSDVLAHKIQRSVASFALAAEGEREKRFLFVLEDTLKKKLIGSVGIISHVGLSAPFYSYKLSTIVQASADVDVYSQQRVLHMVNDYTDATEVGSLFLLPEYRRDGIGKFLARARYLMLAQFPKVFSDRVIAEIRGVQDEDGQSPFYRHLAQHFFQMDFQRADFINATKGGQFISDLMPKYPIYVNLLDKRAQDVIGKPFSASLPAMRMLEAEGFRNQGYVDVFDAGPTMEVQRSRITTVMNSKESVIADTNLTNDATTHIISNTNLLDFRMTYASVAVTPNGISIGADVAQYLGLEAGMNVRWVEA